MKDRLQEELKRLGLSVAKASRLAGQSSPQILYNVLRGQQRLTSDVLGNLALLGVDVVYILTGKHNDLPAELSPDEAALLDDFRNLDEESARSLQQLSTQLAKFNKLKK
jgi:hypothetical protein